MKDFKHWGIRRRVMSECNYNSIWYNLKTVRLGSGEASELSPGRSEFYDIGINTKCNARCPWCYTNADRGGENYSGIVRTWNDWLGSFPPDIQEGVSILTEKPFQVAIGSTGEPTIHPEFCDLLQAIYESGVVPNYTTNGLALSDRILEYTRNFCGAVAVSFGNKELRPQAQRAVQKLVKDGQVKVAIHHLISDNNSVDEMLETAREYGPDIHYHVLLPLMKHGRSVSEMEPSTFDYLQEKLLGESIENVAFGANFSKYLGELKIRTWNYPPESLSKNIILGNGKVIITPSSFNLTPLEIWKKQ